jgi:hypothetical protein
MRNQADLTINGTRYSVMMYAPSKFLKLTTKISKLLGEPMAMLVANMKGKNVDLSEMDLNEEVVGLAIKALVEKLDPDAMPDFVNELLDGVEVIDGNIRRQVRIDVDFMGNVSQMFAVLKETLKFQYADFFGALATVMPSVAGQKNAKNTIKAK